MKNNNSYITRRNFLRTVGAGGVAAMLARCGVKRADDNVITGTSTSAAKKSGEMTYRTNPSTGDKVSILGYGCMRWPTLPEKVKNG